MLRVGRGRASAKDLPLGMYPVKGRYYCRPVNEEMRQKFSALFEAGKIATPRCARLGADKDLARKEWVKLFVPAVTDSTATEGTVAYLIERYERDIIPKLVGDELKAAQRQCKTLKAEFGDRRYAKSEPEAATGKFLRTMDVQHYLDREKDREFEDRSGKVVKGRPVAANREVKRLSRIFKLAKRKWGYTEYNPCLQVEYNPEFEREQYQDDDMFMRMYEKASVTMQCLMDLAQMNGARRGMLLRISLADADLAKPHLRLTLNKRRHGRPSKIKLVPWTDDLRDVVTRALAHRAAIRQGKRAARFASVSELDTAPLFLSRTGKPYGISAFGTEWRRARERAGVVAHAFHFHDIKAKALSDSPNVQDAQERGDHADQAITRKVYRRKPAVVQPLARVSKKAV